MFQQALKSSTVFVVVLIVALSLCALNAAPRNGQASTQTVTGCLQNGLESGGFFIIANGEKHWELYPSGGVSLAGHVGQTVTVTGVPAGRTAGQEEKSQGFEKKEMGDKQHADLLISDVKVVSQTCSK
jgi:hypothetical protein